jgi:hypothetical protein
LRTVEGSPQTEQESKALRAIQKANADLENEISAIIGTAAADDAETALEEDEQ